MLSRLSIATRQADLFSLVNELDRLNAQIMMPMRAGSRLALVWVWGKVRFCFHGGPGCP